VTYRDPVEEAERIRLFTWGDVFPVDPAQIARQLGVDVRRAAVRREISGALVKKLGEDPRILLNANDHIDRQRFACAHELGHFIAQEVDPDEYEYIDLRQTMYSASGRDPDELFANRFAAQLLMPEDEVRRLIDSGISVTLMARRFRVSQDVMANHLKSLGVSGSLAYALEA
jgi:Zn-dependent peptidase ImmA (M78 family)